MIAAAVLALLLAPGCGGEEVEKVVYKAEISANSGIQSGDEVRIGDETVGEVERVEPARPGFDGEERELITMELVQESVDLREDALVLVNGDAGRVQLRPGDPAFRPLAPGTTIRIERTELCGTQPDC